MQNILWAVDLLSDDDSTQESVIEALTPLLEVVRPKVTPVTLFPTTRMFGSRGRSWPVEDQMAELQPHLRKAKMQMTRLRSLVKSGVLTDPIIISEPGSRTEDLANALCEYAERANADSILVGTHARHGAARGFLGSFAETLILHSTIPVLLVNPSYRPTPLKHILFPTDFQETSKQIFDKVVTLTKSAGARLTVFHSYYRPSNRYDLPEPGVYSLGDAGLDPPPYTDEARIRLEQLARPYVDAANEAGVWVELRLEPHGDSPPLDVAEAILDATKKFQANFIAIAAQSGRLRAALAGSTARRVLRGAQCLVWVLHQNPSRRSEKGAA